MSLPAVATVSSESPFRFGDAISFCVVIPTRDRREWLVQCLESVSSQKHPASEVIVIDDGSIDGTAEMLRERYPAVRVLRTIGVGPARARNAGISAATSAYVAFLDSDDLWYPDTLAHMAGVLSVRNPPAIICGRTEGFEGNDPPNIPPEHRQALSARIFQSFVSALPLPEFPHPSTVAIRRETLALADGFASDGWNGEDVDLFLRIGGSGGCAVIDEPPLAMRRSHSLQLNRNLDLAVSGILRLIKRERNGLYPGGKVFAVNRRGLIGACARYYVPQLFAQRRWLQAFRLGLPAFLWALKYEPKSLHNWLQSCWDAARRNKLRTT
jgi:glycosyltransferase involved in cell wall biosynthesis